MERSPNGFTTCRNGHRYPNTEGRKAPTGQPDALGQLIREARERCGCGNAERELAKEVLVHRRNVALATEGLTVQRVPAVISPNGNVIGMGAHSFTEAMQQARKEGNRADTAMTALDALAWQHTQTNTGAPVTGLSYDGYTLTMVEVRWRAVST
jgi:hypothetical protein